MPWTECTTCSDLNPGAGGRTIPFVAGYPYKLSIPCEKAKAPGSLPRDCGFPNECCDPDNCPPVKNIGVSEVCEAVGGKDVVFVSGPRGKPVPDGSYSCDSGLENIIREVNCMAANPCYPDPQNFTCTCDGEVIDCPQCPDNTETDPGPGEPGYAGEPYLGVPGTEDSYQRVASEIIHKQNKICRNDCQKHLQAALGSPEGMFRFKVNPLVLVATGSVTITVETADGRTLTIPTEEFKETTTIAGTEFAIPLVPICKVQRTAQQSYPNWNPGSPNHRDWDGHKQPGSNKENGDGRGPRGIPRDPNPIDEGPFKDPGDFNRIPVTRPKRGGMYIDPSTDGQRVQVLPMTIYYTSSWGFPGYAARTRPAGENAECTQFIFDVYVSMSQQEYFGTNLTGGNTLGSLCASNRAFTDASQWDHGESNGGSTPIVVPDPGLSFTICPGDGKNPTDEISKIGKQKQPLAPFVAQHEKMLAEAEAWAKGVYGKFPGWVADQVGAAFADGICRVTYSSSWGGISEGLPEDAFKNR